MNVHVLACVAVLAGCAGASREVPQQAPTVATVPLPVVEHRALGITLSPVCETGSPASAMDVRVEVVAPDAASPPVFRIGNPTDAPALQPLVEALRLTDEVGEIAVQPELAVGEDRERRLFFRGDRASHGKLTLTYRMRSVPTADAGIRFGLRHDDRGIGGSGDGFLILPSTGESFATTVTWDPGHCATAGHASSALGLGLGPLEVDAPPDALRQAAFFFGSDEVKAFDDGTTHLRLAVIGDVTFDENVALAYAGRILVAERAVFGDDDPTPFYAFMRVLPQMTTKVVGAGNLYGYNSVVGPDAEWNPRMRNHLAHELLHHWIGVGLWVKDAEHVSGYWFTEGFTTRYARTIALRTHSISASEYLEEINKHAAAFYGSPLRGASNAVMERAVEDGEGDPSLGLMPYYKGSLYADELDGEIRAASGGKRSLDDVMRELLTRAKTAPKNEAGYAQIDEEMVRAVIEKELGPAGAARFDAVVRHGEIPRPGPDAMGPCFERRDQNYGELEGYAWLQRPGVPDARCGTP